MMHAHSLGRAARFYPERAAFATAGGRVTFRELRDRVGRTAAGLRRHGFRAGDRLAVLLPNDTRYIELVYACAWLGVTIVPLNTRLSVVELDRILEDATPRGLIRYSSLPTPTLLPPWHLVLDQEPLDQPDEAPPEPLYDPEATLALVYTSGTTGHPKGVVLSHAAIQADVDHVNYWTPYGEGCVYLHAGPLFHILDFPFLFAAPAFGARQVTIPKFSATEFCETVQRERITHTVLVPTMINLLTRLPGLAEYDLTSLEQIAYGGSPASPELLRRTRSLLPRVKLLQGYGLSEAGFLTALRNEEHDGDRLKSCGRTCPGIDMRVVDESGKEVPAGSPGELVARGANVMRGYWNNPGETALAFRNGFFRTGDIGYQDRDGYFFIMDRLKDMIVTGGENVYSGEVEAVLDAHPAVREAAVFGLPDSEWGEIVVACIVPIAGSHPSAEALVAHCRRSLAHYKVPRRFEFSETDLPKSGTGKVLKRLLRERYAGRQERPVG